MFCFLLEEIHGDAELDAEEILSVEFFRSVQVFVVQRSMYIMAPIEGHVEVELIIAATDTYHWTDVQTRLVEHVVTIIGFIATRFIHAPSQLGTEAQEQTGIVAQTDEAQLHFGRQHDMSANRAHTLVCAILVGIEEVIR